MEQFFKHFFGAADPNGPYEFKNFSLAHFLPILVCIGVVYLIFHFRKKLAAYKHEDRIRLALGFTLIITEMSYFWRLVGVQSLNPNPVDHLPITVCGWAVIFSSFMIVGKKQTLFDIVYFWLFSGTVFALITPTVISYTGPTRFRYYQFWLEHTLGYVAVFYLIFVHGMRPTWRSMAKSYIALVVMGGIAFFANRMIGPGANYLFLAKPEDTPSVLDILPANFVLRVAVMIGVVTVMFFLAYAPWYLKDRKEKK